MPILDQFDVATDMVYSGSYTDNVVVRFSGSNITDRKFLGSKAQKIHKSAFINVDSLYSDYLFYISGSVLGKNSNFINLTSGDEIFYDSLLPSPVEYHVANGAELIANRDPVKGWADLDIPGFGNSGSFILYVANTNVTTSLTTKVSGSETLQMCDTKWVSSFPFESKYKSLNRLKKITHFLPKDYDIKIYISRSAGAVSQNYLLLNPPIKINTFSGRIDFIELNLTSSVPDVLNNTTSSQDYVRTVMCDFSKSFIMNISAFELGQREKLEAYDSVGILADITDEGEELSPPLKETYKMYFGRGRKNITVHTPQVGAGIIGRTFYCSGKMPNFFDHYREVNTLNSVSGSPNDTTRIQTRSGIGVIVSGWKYGIYNAFPTNSTIIFRRSHFGHLRDMLEQRPFSKFDNGKNVAQGPVIVTFISGTDSYVTATNDSVLNIKDSGMFRKEYTSGRPFADDL